MLRCMKNSFLKKLDNKGSTLVTVIIIMAFIAILATSLMYSAMMNYQMKVNNLMAKDSFYSAESVLDEIRMGMQSEVSVSLQKAYSEILVNFETLSTEEKQNRLRYSFLTDMQNTYKAGTDINSYDLRKLYDYLDNSAAGAVLVTKDAAGTEHSITKNAAGNYVDRYGNLIAADSAKGVITIYEDGISLRDLKVIYTDADNFVSIIETDLRVSMPDMEFAEGILLPDLAGFSLIAQHNIVAMPDAITDDSTNTIHGSFYGDRFVVGSETQATGVKVKLEEDAADPNMDKRMVVNKDIYMGQGTSFSADTYGELWMESLYMHGGNGTDSVFDIDGADVYVAGDTEIYGDGNSLAIGAVQADGSYKGKYTGFGNGGFNSETSAIVINGVNTDINFSELAELTLAGNAYVGLSRDADGIVPEDGVTNGTVPDLVMGQSIAVKSDQIAYLVPAECIGINKTTGEAVMPHTTNPMTLEDYNNYIKGKADVTEVSDQVVSTALGGKALSDYGLDTDGAEPAFRRYFKRVNSKITLVYYYVLFDNTDTQSLKYANAYFKDYYNANKETMDAYASLYTDGIQIRDLATGFYTLHLAGNVVSKDAAGAAAELTDSTLATDELNVSYQYALENNYYKFEALTKKLVDTYDSLTAAEKAEAANVYTNLVRNESVIGFAIGVDADATITDRAGAKYFGEGTERAVVIKGDFTYPSDGITFDGLIIATGDVIVNSSFKGTILSGGNITLKKDVKVEPAEDAVLKSLAYSKTVNGLEYHITDFLLGGAGYLSGTGKIYKDSNIDLGELITYENWEKQ